MLQHETKVNPQQLWEDEWEDEELSDGQLENICGGTEENNYFLTITTPNDPGEGRGPNVGQAIVGFEQVLEQYGNGTTGSVFDLNLGNGEIVVNP